MELNRDLIHGFVGSLLAHRFDSPSPIPACHLEWWDACCSKSQFVAIAAPRNHAKSTAITKSYTLAALLFRERSFALIVSDTNSQAVLFLQEIAAELRDNKDLVEIFEIQEFIIDREDDILVQCKDGHQFRIMAFGSEQKVRGAIWNNKRPDLIMIDDCENDELVMNQDRREKMRHWFFSALLPARSRSGVVRMVGTILHQDALLERLMPYERDKYCVRTPLFVTSTNRAKQWKSYRYQAHDPEFENILWPERWPKEALLSERQTCIEQGMPEKYSQEYLNRPLDMANAYFKKDDFVGMTLEDKEIPKEQLNYYIGCDLATTLKQRQDYCAFVVGAVDPAGIIHIVYVLRKRMEAAEIIDTLFRLNDRFKPVSFTIEKGLILSTLMPFIKTEMLKRNKFIHIDARAVNTQDKRQRARGMQARMGVGGVRFDKQRDWYPDFESELLRFDRDVHDDQVDAFAWLGITIDQQTPGATEKELQHESWEDEVALDGQFTNLGRSLITGY